MLLKLLIVFTLFTTISTISTKSLVELPLKVPKGSLAINATLTDVNGSKKYFIQELISSSGSTIKGKILVSSDTDSYSIHYNADSQTGVDSKERLVIQGTNCLLFTYKNSWDKTLPGIQKPLLNQILSMGPSILYRLDQSLFNWESVADKNIRGIMMKGASAKVNENLKVTFYYKSHLDYQSGIESPSRIEFSGYDKASSPYPGRSSMIYIDTYLKNEISLDKYQNEVQPPTGIGCPHYLSGSKELPGLRVHHLHYIMEERIKGSTTSRSLSEIYAAEFYGFLRIKTTLLGSISEVIYDYRLGVAFHVKEDGFVAVVSIDSNTPGIMHSTFTLNNLFMLNGNYKYLGKLNLEHRSRVTVEAWEAVQYDVHINEKKVDKAVITQYFTQSQQEDIFWNYSLVSTKISIYNYDLSKKVFIWKDDTTRDYMSFQEARSIESIRSLTEKVDFASTDEKVILNFVLECDESCHASSECISFQYCDGSCSFGDLLYTDAATEYDEECMIYTRKVSERYQRTGNKIVSDGMMTETKLTLDQCASLCYELSDGDETGCKSFNYCPKSRTESSCSMTHFSVKSPDTKTTDGGNCANYELKESNGKKRKESSLTKVIKGTSGSGAFGIIMLFLFVGTSLGFIAPFAYSKIKQMHDASKTDDLFYLENTTG